MKKSRTIKTRSSARVGAMPSTSLQLVGHTRSRSNSVPFLRRVPSSPSTFLTSIEDNRLWNPARFTPERRVSTRIARVSVSTSPASLRSSVVPHRVQFYAPSNVITCVRRNVRRRSIFASGRAGTRVRRPRFKPVSKISC